MIHLLITGDEGIEAFSQIPPEAKVVLHHLDVVADQLRIARETGTYEVLKEAIHYDYIDFKDSPPLRTYTNPNETSADVYPNTHCGSGETVSTWWNRANNPANPVTIQHVVPHYTFHVTKP